MRKVGYWIDKLGLEEHPEGGFFREIYRADEKIAADALPSRFNGERACSTAIYFLLTSETFSALHRIASDEVWHYYYGAPLSVHEIDSSGNYRKRVLGTDLDNGESPQLVVPAGSWFGAAVNLEHAYTLVGCTVAPGFDFQDFELAEREVLLTQYPRHRDIIEKLTRAATA